MTSHWWSALPAAALVAVVVISSAHAEIRIGIAAPLTGSYAWNGEETRAGADLALQDLNARGGVLGQLLVGVLVDDVCDPDQALAAANKLVASDVQVVVGHQCSGAAIPASSVYEAAGIILISPAATNPRLTDRGLRYTFRTSGRDDLQGVLVADHLARTWPATAVAIIHDGQAYGEGIADEVRHRLGERGIQTAVYERIWPAQTDFADLVSRLMAEHIAVVFYGGCPAEAGLLVRQAKERLPELGFVVPDGVASEDFWLIAGDAAEGIAMTSYMGASGQPAGAEVAAALRTAGTDPVGTELYAYAAVQAWAQAVEHAGTTEAAEVAAILRRGEFDTVLGRIGFDDKGDVTGFDPFIWSSGRTVPMCPRT